jgi:hypothetical protein
MARRWARGLPGRRPPERGTPRPSRTQPTIGRPPSCGRGEHGPGREADDMDAGPSDRMRAARLAKGIRERAQSIEPRSSRVPLVTCRRAWMKG